MVPSLPDDIILLIAERLEFDDLIRVSSASRSLRNLLASLLFKGLRSTNNASEANLVENIAERYGQHVRHFSFVLHVNAQTLFNLQLCDAACILLQGCLLPRVRDVEIRTIAQVPLDETPEHVGEVPSSAESQRLGLTSMFRIASLEMDDLASRDASYMVVPWECLITNANIRRLRFDTLLPVSTPAFDAVEFSQFLGRLEAIEMSIPGMLCTRERLTFLRNMGTHFFRHLISVKEFRISFPDEMDFLAWLHADQAWEPEYMPRLKLLAVKRMFIGDGITELILSHSSTLEILHLNRCVCSPNNDLTNWDRPAAGIWMSWHDFLQCIRQAEPVLRELEITPRNAFDPEHITTHIGVDGFESRSSPREDPSEVFNVPGRPGLLDQYFGISRTLEQDQNLRMFEYFDTMRNSEGKIVASGYEQSAWEFLSGNDQREYDLLMEVVRRNAAHSS